VRFLSKEPHGTAFARKGVYPRLVHATKARPRSDSPPWSTTSSTGTTDQVPTTAGPSPLGCWAAPHEPGNSR